MTKRWLSAGTMKQNPWLCRTKSRFQATLWQITSIILHLTNLPLVWFSDKLLLIHLYPAGCWGFYCSFLKKSSENKAKSLHRLLIWYRQECFFYPLGLNVHFFWYSIALKLHISVWSHPVQLSWFHKPNNRQKPETQNFISR